MRWSTVFLLLAALTLLGCESSENSLTKHPKLVSGGPDPTTLRIEDKAVIETPCTIGGTPIATFYGGPETVDILNQYSDGDTKVLLARWDKSEVCRWVRLSSDVVADAADTTVSCNAQILEGAQVLFSIDLVYDVVGETIQLTESAGNDELQVVIEDIGSDMVNESYSFNSASPATFIRSETTTAGELQTQLDQICASKQVGSADVFGTSSAPYDNEEGVRLLQLVEDTNFAEWVYSLDNTGDLEQPTNRWGFRDWLSGCVLVKCTLGGGPGNPVCTTCMVVDGGLWLTKALVCIVDCDAWPPGL
jgi:hypothetical protein